ncbi:MAG: peptide chain release factor N(5)-glutamine methyltransferase [Gammaproteobacteria bacterium]|nr:peptide chain release factor N(5)-glutamine methyltransferase [Gammaproteobacteria bacterium]
MSAVTVAELLREGRRALAGGDAPVFETELFLAAAIEGSRADLFRAPEHVPAASQIERFRDFIARRSTGLPAAYILRHREFRDLDLIVTPDVLVPRPETELLVEQTLALADAADAPLTIADLGTGTGAVALTIAHSRPLWTVYAVDISTAALDVARANALRHRCTNVAFSQGNWLDAFNGPPLDMIVSNPPYVTTDDPAFSTGETRHEPRLALDGGPDGLDAYRAILTQAENHLKPGGRILFEHGALQGEAVRRILADHGFIEPATVKDLAALDRVTHALRPA